MADSVLLALAQLCSIAGMAWLALAKKEHWGQLSARPLSGSARHALRAGGAVALAAALVFCASADHPSVAALVWVMGLGASALLVAFALAWRPRWLRCLVPWLWVR